jgi:tetratricopeptide (TPR) repeat protein
MLAPAVLGKLAAVSRRTLATAIPGVLAAVFLGILATGTLRSQVDTGGSVQSNSADPAIDEVYERGREALAANRNGEAVDLLRTVAEHRPNDIELFYWIGVASWDREDAPGAIAAYRRAVELDPGKISPWSLYALENLAEVYTRTDHSAESKEAYQQALRRETRPEWIAKIQNQLAELDLTLGIYDPDENTVFNERGEVIGGVGPGLMRTNRNFEIARHTGDPVKEEKYYRLAIKTDPSMYQSYFNLGYALVKQGRFGEAIPWLERSDVAWKDVKDANPERFDKADAHAFLARCHLELRNIERASEHGQRALDADSTYFWVRLYAQRVKIALGQARDALPALETLAAENPEHNEILDALAQARAAIDSAEK